VVAVLASGGVGRAEPPCLADIQKFCSDVGVGAGRIQACLKAHEAELSPRCKPDVDRLRKKAGDLAAVCVFDIQRFCIIEGPGGEGVGPGGGAIATCLQQHLDDLSPECKAKFK
jgi:hypothetical protein